MTTPLDTVDADSETIGEAQDYVAQVRALIAQLMPYARQDPDHPERVAALKPRVLRLLLACSENWCDITEAMQAEILERHATRH